jgi:dienelactone hydrolase
MEISNSIHSTIKVILGMMVMLFVGVAVLLGSFWLDHNRATALPAPTGPYPVGRTTYVWSDASPAEPNSQREILAWIWYPAAAQQPNPSVVDYLPGPWRTALKRNTSPIFTHFISRDSSRVRAYSFRDAQVSPQQRSYPVVFMRAGLAALTTDYTSLAEDVASHGYVVVGFDAPYRSFVVVFPDGRVITRVPQNNADLFSGPEQEQLATRLVHAWSEDMGFALDQLERLNASDPSRRFLGRLDLQRVGAFGHSLGGATALQFCHNDSRCKVGIDVDGAPLGSVVAQGLTKPFMFLLSDHGHEPESETRPVWANIHSLYDRLPGDGRYGIMIRGANHFGFSDGAITRSPLLMGVLHTFGILPLDGRRQIAITRRYVSAFFDVYLKGAPASELNIQSEYPEIQFIH